MRRALRGLLGPGLVALVGVAVLIGLGAWQLRRLQWKNDLIARVELRAAAAPVSLSEALDIWRRAPAEAEFQRVRLNGAFLHQRELYVYVTLQGAFGWAVVTPFVTGAYIVPVIRGVVPDARKDPATRPEGQIAGAMEIVGRIRLPEVPSVFTPAADPAKRTWFVRDFASMEPYLGESTRVGASPPLAPFFVELESPAPPGALPKPNATRIALRNDHLGYAVTWFGLAAVLIVFFGVFARAQWNRNL